MKKFVLTISLTFFLVCSANAVLRAYVSDCGRVFYYYNNRSSWGKTEPDKVTDEERAYVHAQCFYAEKTEGLDCDKERLRSEVREARRRELYRVYQSNCAYMSQNFGVHYTFDQIYEILSHFFDGITYNGFCSDDYTFMIWVLSNDDFLIRQDKIEKYNREYPYWLGYLYKAVKYDDNGRRLPDPTDIMYP